MGKEDIFSKNHMLGVEFDRYLLEHPEVMEQIPENSEIYFLPEEDPELSGENLRAAELRRDKGGRVLLVRLGKLAPLHSRLQDVQLEPLTL